MLTQDQLIQLQPFTQHPRYGKLLSDAIEIWKQENVKPVWGGFGIRTDETFQKPFMFENKVPQCCLVGAALIGKTPTFSRKDTICHLYDISSDEYDDLWLGFDNDGGYINHDAWEFANKVRDIINPENYNL